MKKTTYLLLFLLVALSVKSQIPAGYYNSATGLTGAPLKTALYNIIKNHTVIGYDNLWNAYETTDDNASGHVWDMYSNCTFTFGTDQCGNYQVECDCYNREHSFPQSWFNSSSPMVSDLFHVYPTDGKVNGYRGNYPYGTVSSPSTTTGNGSKVGNCSYPGYTGTVFEPINEYKGDFARTYFYMATRYENLIASWHSNDVNAEAVLLPNSFPAYETWFLNMLGEWHVNDPVSQKEIDRNNDVYTNYQHNRNPYIDHPEYVYQVWGVGGSNLPTPTITGPNSVCRTSTGNIYTTESGQLNYIWAVSSGGTITAGAGNSITVTWNTAGAQTVSVNYTTSGGSTAATPTVYNVTVNALPTPTITGPANVTVGTTGSIYSTQSGMTNYLWAISPGGSLTAGGGTTQNTATISWNQVGAQSVSVNYVNSNGCTASAATSYPVTVNIQAEPSDYPADFSAHSIILHWSDAAGANVPEAYLIRMSDQGFSAIQTPVDGTPVSNSATDLNVPYGVQQAWFANLTPNTTYYFKIFGYSGTGGGINYKTDGVIPQIQQLTSP
jgi:endonuclease I